MKLSNSIQLTERSIDLSSTMSLYMDMPAMVFCFYLLLLSVLATLGTFIAQRIALKQDRVTTADNLAKWLHVSAGVATASALALIYMFATSATQIFLN